MLLLQLIFATTVLSSAVNRKRATPFGDLTGSNCNSACYDAGKTLSNSCGSALQDTADYSSYVKCFCDQNNDFWNDVAKCDCADGDNSGLTGSELRAQICDDSGIFSALSEYSDLSIDFGLTAYPDSTETNENADSTEANETDAADINNDTNTDTAGDSDTGTSGSATAESSPGKVEKTAGSGTTTKTDNSGTSGTTGSTDTIGSTGTTGSAGTTSKSATSETESSASANGAKALSYGISVYLLALWLL